MKDSSQFNAVNNITQMIDGAGTHNFTYDTRDRLTAATHPNQPNESYTLDDVGNRTASHQGPSYNYQPFNRLVTANGTTFGYDTNGNQISKTDASGSWTYSSGFREPSETGEQIPHQIHSNDGDTGGDDHDSSLWLSLVPACRE